MDAKVKSALGTAVSLWFNEALAEIKQRPEQWAELKACFAAGREVRVTYHARSNVVAVEVVNADGSISELLRDYLMPGDGITWPEFD